MKKFIVILTVVLVILGVASCGGANALGEYESPFLVDIIPIAFFRDSAFIIDKETGVNYICVSGMNGLGICPRYNADGTLYVSEVE